MMDFSEINLNELSFGEVQMLYLNAYISLYDTSDFNEGEVRVIKPKNPVHIKEIEKWDRVLINENPIVGSYGINKSKQWFVYTGKEWRTLSK